MINKHERTTNIDFTVFGISLALVAIFCVFGALWPIQVGEYAGRALDWVVFNTGWVFVLTSTGFVVFAFALAFSPYGRIRLSREGEPPDFSRVSWVAMMFSAGMGIGLIFYGVFEPVAHLANPAPWLDVQAGTAQAARLSLGYTLFHWGLHPWAIYAVVGLALAYSTFRKGRGNLLSAPFQPLSRSEHVEETWWGKAINIWAIIATKFGGATSLGLGALQIAGGIAMLTGIGTGFDKQGGSHMLAFAVIVVLVTIAILSAVSGVAKGIKWLSNTNMVVAALLLLFVLILGPTVLILNLIPATFGVYLTNFVQWSFHSTAFGGSEWMSNWTIFYWAWWISWAPFVSTFIARVSRGRTIREFVLAVMIVPTIVSGLWFAVFGGAGMYLQLNGIANIADAPSAAVAFFSALQHFPFFLVTASAVIFLVAIFWISGADASALVLGMLSSRGITEPNKWLIALWAGLSAAVAIALLYVGGLGALQTFTILVATPFVLVMCALCWALFTDLRNDPMMTQSPGAGRQSWPSAE